MAHFGSIMVCVLHCWGVSRYLSEELDTIWEWGGIGFLVGTEMGVGDGGCSAGFS